MTPNLVESRILTTPLSRTYSVRMEHVDEENLEVEISFSSEEPVRRYFWDTGEYGFEILDHSPGSARLDRINTKGPVLKAHSRDQWLGKVLEAWIDEGARQGRAKLKFHKSEAAEFADVASGTKDSVSFGYAVHEMVLESTGDDGPTYRVTDWEPIEISFEPTPADITVGRTCAPGDLAGEPRFETLIRSESSFDHSSEEGRTMGDKNLTPASSEDLARVRSEAADEARRDARETELARVRKIHEIADQYADKVPAIRKIAGEAISEELTADQFERLIGPILSAAPAETFVEDGEGSRDVGLSRKETESFSLLRLLRAKAFGHESRRFVEDAAMEIEACEAAAERSEGRLKAGFFVPAEVLRAPTRGSAARGALMNRNARLGRRDLLAGTATAGAELVQTDVGSSIIDFLRDASTLLARATVLRGLRGNFSLPRVNAGVTGSWVGEGVAAAEETPTLGQMLLNPRSLIVPVDVSKRLILQDSIDVEAWLRREMAAGLGQSLEIGGITDDAGNTNRPEGLLGIAGTVQHNVGAGSFDWTHVVGYEANVALGAALTGDLAYLTNPKVVHLMKTTSRDAGSGRFIMEEGQANGFDVLSTNNVPSNLGGGSDSAMIFGDMAAAVFGIWEELGMTVDPYSKADAGLVRVTAQTEADFNVRTPESFSVAEDITTTL